MQKVKVALPNVRLLERFTNGSINRIRTTAADRDEKAYSPDEQHIFVPAATGRVIFRQVHKQERNQHLNGQHGSDETRERVVCKWIAGFPVAFAADAAKADKEMTNPIVSALHSPRRHKAGSPSETQCGRDAAGSGLQCRLSVFLHVPVQMRS